MTSATDATATPPATSLPTSTTPPQPSGYKGLKVWQRAMDLAVVVHQLARTLPKAEHDTLGAELRRLAVQIPSFIAAGNSLFQRTEYVQYLSAAHGTIARLESTLLLVERLGYVPAKDVAALGSHAGDVGRMVRALSRALQPPSTPPGATGTPARPTRRTPPAPATAEA
jgi:four helix bundle protein